MYDCYYGLKSHKWEVKQFECTNLASQLMCGSHGDEKVIGFHCQDHEVAQYFEKLKCREIKDRQIEINTLQKELDNIVNMKPPM